jgi:hypothetical protein
VWHAGGSPFDEDLVTEVPGLVQTLGTMVKILRLWKLKELINPAQFAAICELSSLEDLRISGSGEAADGQEVLHVPLSLHKSGTVDRGEDDP